MDAPRPVPPPLLPDALEQLPAVLTRLRALWQALATLAPTVQAGLGAVDPERMTAPALTLEVAWQRHLLEIVFKAVAQSHGQLFRLQETEPYWLVDHEEMVAQDIEDEAAVTD